jgi:hypothetical protein
VISWSVDCGSTNKTNHSDIAELLFKVTLYTITVAHIERSSNKNPTKTGGELRCSGRVGSPFSTSGTSRVNLLTNP